MQLPTIQNNNTSTSFLAGEVKLNGIKENELPQYNLIKQISEENNCDLSITKRRDSNNFPKYNSYVVIAKIKINKYMAHGMTYVITEKESPSNEVSDKLYKAVLESVKKLFQNIMKYTRTKSKF